MMGGRRGPKTAYWPLIQPLTVPFARHTLVFLLNLFVFVRQSMSVRLYILVRVTKVFVTMLPLYTSQLIHSL